MATVFRIDISMLQWNTVGHWNGKLAIVAQKTWRLMQQLYNALQHDLVIRIYSYLTVINTDVSKWWTGIWSGTVEWRKKWWMYTVVANLCNCMALLNLGWTILSLISVLLSYHSLRLLIWAKLVWLTCFHIIHVSRHGTFASISSSTLLL